MINELATTTQPNDGQLVGVQKPGGQLALADIWNREQIETIKGTIAKGATDQQLALFANVCHQTGLSPWTRQVYLIPDGRGSMTIQIGIDGYRLIAERTGRYQGQEGPFWCGPDGIWTDIWLSKSPPMAAKMGVWKQGFKAVLWAVARMDSYNKGTPTWKAMPDVMIAKVAESLALRRAFPNELSGIITDVEVGEPMDTDPTPPTVQQLPPRQVASVQADTTLDADRDQAREQWARVARNARNAGVSIPDGWRILKSDTATDILGKADIIHQHALEANHAPEPEVIDAEHTAVEPEATTPQQPAAATQPITAQSREILGIYQDQLIKAGKHTPESLAEFAAEVLGWAEPPDDWSMLSEADAMGVRQAMGELVRNLEEDEPEKPTATGKGGKKK